MLSAVSTGAGGKGKTMASFGKTSSRRLVTCHAVLQMLFKRVVVRRDCSVTCGHRSNEDQDALYAQGRTLPGKIVTNAKGGESSHNTSPSAAVDAVPYPELWSSAEAFKQLASIVWDEWAKMKDAGESQGFELVWGGDWDGDRDPNDTDDWDKPHWELR